MSAALLMDFETTGLTLHPSALLALQPRIIEVGAVLIDLANGDVLEEFSQLINPRVTISDEITKITGITNEAVKDAPYLEAYLPVLRRAFASSVCLVAHNQAFDKAVLGYELRRVNWADDLWPWPARDLCTGSIYRPEWGRMPKLTELYERRMGKPLEQTHRALDDVLAMAEVIRADQLWKLM